MEIDENQEVSEEIHEEDSTVVPTEGSALLPAAGNALENFLIRSI